MKTLIILLALILSAPIALSAEQPSQQKQSTSDRLKDFKNKKPESDHEALENEIVQLQIALRESRRRYYAAKTENEKLKASQTATESTGYTEEQVTRIVESAQTEIYYGGLKYAVGERTFLLSLTKIDDIKWLLRRTKKSDIDRIEDIKGDDITYKKEIEDVVKDYISYYNANRYRQQQQAQQAEEAQ